MRERLTDLLCIALIPLAFIAGCNWNQPEPCNPEVIPGKETVKIKYITLSDSTKEKPKPKKTYPAPPPPFRPTASIDTTGDALVEAMNDSIREYELYYSDSSVMVRSTVQGILLNQAITAHLTEKTVYRTDTIIKPPKWAFYGGVSLSYNHIAPTAILCKNKAYISAGYDLINRMPVVGYGVRLLKNKK